MKFCCRTAHELDTNNTAIHIALGGQSKFKRFRDETIEWNSKESAVHFLDDCKVLLTQH